MNAFIKYLPTVLQSIFAVQAAVPTLAGASKKQLVLDLVKLGIGVTQTIPNDHVQQISAGIDGAVTALQAAGVFGKDQAPSADVKATA